MMNFHWIRLAAADSGMAKLARKFTTQVLFFIMAVMVAQSPVLADEAANTTDPLDLIKARGKVVIGVEKDIPLWGYQEARTGELSGMEIDLAHALAKQLGVTAELVGIRSFERIEALQTGRVDVLIAALSDSLERRQQVKMIQPHYYSSGVNLLARKSEKFKDWKELKNRRVCGRLSSFYNRPITVTYGADIVAFHSLDWALRAVRDGRCSALVYDSTVIISLLQQPEWGEGFEMPMPSLYDVPWAVAIDYRNAGSELEHKIASVIIGWHRDGYFVDVERAWGIPASAFVRDMHAVWNKKKSDDSWYCGTEIFATTPLECL